MIIKVVLLMVAIFLGVGLYFSRQAMYPKTRSDDSVWKAECERMPSLAEFYEEAAFETVAIPSHEGYMLSGWWFEVPEPKGVVVVVHGIRMNKFASIKYMRMFHELGYHVLAYDQRNHGDSGGEYTTFGVLESEDLRCVVDWALQKTAHRLRLYTHGESMGAATVLMHAAKDRRIEGVISDCSYSDAERIFKERLRVESHLPPWPILPLAEGINRLKTGIDYRAMSPISSVAGIAAPVLIIHGTTDRYVPIEHAERLCHALKDRRTVPVTCLSIEGAGHAKSISTDYETYYEACRTFLNSCDMAETAMA
jgi:dipeptidyl aminopeptidase/acylaminoacyl peptidase